MGIFFLSVPLDGTVLLFSVPMSAGDPDGLAGQAGVSKVPYQGAPLSGYEERALDATSPGRGLVSDDGVGFPRIARRWDPGPRPTKGSASPPGSRSRH